MRTDRPSAHLAFPALGGLRRRAATRAVATRHVLPLLATAALAPALAPTPASAGGWTCDASAVTGTVLGTTAIEPAVAGSAGGACRTVESKAGVPLPAPLGSGTLVAGTSLQGGTAAASQTAIAAGGLAQVSAGSLRDLGLTVPQVAVPAAVRSLPVDLSAVNALLPETLTVPQLPLPPLLPGGPVITVPALVVPVPKLRTTSTTLDIGAKVDELVGGAARSLPDVKLLELTGAMAYASGSCADGRPRLSGLTQVAGLSVLGRELPTDRAVSETLTLLEAGTIDLSTLDVSASSLPGPVKEELDALLAVLPAELDAQVLAAVGKAVDAAVAALPGLPVPSALATVEVRPGTRTADARTLTQRGPSVKLTVLGRPVLDLAIGRATVGAQDLACGVADRVPVPGPGPVTGPVPVPVPVPAASRDVAPDPAGGTEPAALRCTTRKVVLTEVVRRGERVRLRGIADPDLAGETVRLVFAGRTTVAKAVVGRDGGFSAVAEAPAKAVRGTNAARYQAVVDGRRSLDLKLTRRMVLESLERRAGEVVITGRVTGPLASPVAPIKVQRRVSCTRYAEAGTIRPGADGRFRAVVAAPPAGEAAVYRLGTRVRGSLTNAKTYPTFTLPQAVESTR